MKKRTAEKTTHDAVKSGVDGKYEKTGMRHRAGSLLTLASFSLIALMAAVIAMDLLVYPISVFAVSNKPAYNFVFKYGFLLILAAFLLYLMAGKIIRMKREGYSSRDISVHIIKKPFIYLGTALIFILISAVLIYLIYFILNANNSLLSKIFGG